MKITARVDPVALNDALAALSGIENGFVRAYARALNTSVDETQKDMVAMAQDDYNYKVSAVKARMSTARATWSNMVAHVKSKGGAILLSDFVGTRQTSTGLTVNIKTSTGLQRIKHAFLNKARSTGKIISMWRAERDDGRLVARYPVEALYGPHPEVVWGTEQNWATLQERANKRLPAVFAYEVDGVLRQYG